MNSYFQTIIIGSGISGLMTLKHLKEKNHNHVLVIEKHNHPFGVWNSKNHPSVIPETYCVTSKLYMTISDFPMEEDVPEFPHHSDILHYYNQYAQKFDLFKHVKFGVEVNKSYKVKKIWYLKTNKGIFRTHNLVVATGTVNSKLNIPKDSFYKDFTGKIYHGDQFKQIRNQLVNKRILIVGVSETSSDLAIILKDKNKVTMSSRNGVWMASRHLGGKNAADMAFNRFMYQSMKSMGVDLFQKTFFPPLNFFWLSMWGYNGHGIPEWRNNSTYLGSIWNKNRDILTYISRGQIIARSGILKIDKNTVIFNDGKKQDFDVIMLGTGYQAFGGVDFLDEKYHKYLYKYIFSYEDSNLYFVGFIRPFVTGIPMISEFQSRWIAQEIVSNNAGLPSSKKKMLNIILKDQKKQEKIFPRYAYRMKTIVNPWEYCSYIGKKIKATPNLWKYFFTNPTLYNQLEFHTWNHHAYRLNDPDPQKRKIALDNIQHYSQSETSKLIARVCIFSLSMSIICEISLIIVIFLICYIIFKSFRHSSFTD